MSSVVANLAAVNARISAAAQAAGRDPRSIRLVAVAKTHPPEAIRPVLAAGQRLFAENRVQEAKAKWPELKEDFPDTELHLIGPLQTNKVREALALFDCLQSIDRPKLARAVADEMTRSGRRPPCLIQVNTGNEPQKAGVDPAVTDQFIHLCRAEFSLPVIGLMCIPPDGRDPRPHFRQLAEIAGRNGLAVISMGMSGDFELAVELGATHVRVGSAIFGSRG